MKKRVVCTGIGMVSPLAVGARKSWVTLLDSRSGVVKLKDEHTFEGCQARLAAYVPQDELQQSISDPKHDYMIRNAKQLSRATTFAMLAAHEALEDANLLDSSNHLEQVFRARCGTAIGQGMVDFQDIYDNGSLIIDKTNKKGGFRKMSPYFLTRALINMSAGNVSIRYKLKGPNHCVSTACTSGAHSLGDAYSLIRNSRADIMVCGSTEASINSIAVAGFERLRALCIKYNDSPIQGSRPFDDSRCGFVMGEGAGIVVLEDLDHARARGVRDHDIYCELLGYGMSSDAFHLTAPQQDGDGAKMSMFSAMENASLGTSTISHINAHATSTPLGDDIECNAIEDLFYSGDDVDSRNKNKLTVTSCKAAIGHLLGGAGSVESIFAMLSCRDAIIPHCLNLDNPLKTPKGSIDFVRNKPRKWELDRRILIKNSFGFGGTNASLVISNYLN